jgi:hypothetical protein
VWYLDSKEVQWHSNTVHDWNAASTPLITTVIRQL